MLHITVLYIAHIVLCLSTNAIAQDKKPQDLLELANKSYQALEFESSKTYIQKLLIPDSKNKTLLYNLGIIEYKNGNIKDAIGYLTYSHLKGNKNAKLALKTIQNTTDFKIYSKSYIDRILELPLNLFLLILTLFLIWLINQYMKFHQQTPSFGMIRQVFYLFVTCVLLCIIFIKVKKDTEPLAVVIEDTSLYIATNEKSAAIMKVPLGTKIIVKEINDLWYLTSINNRQGFILNKHLFYPQKPVKDT